MPLDRDDDPKMFPSLSGDPRYNKILEESLRTIPSEEEGFSEEDDGIEMPRKADPQLEDLKEQLSSQPEQKIEIPAEEEEIPFAPQLEDEADKAPVEEKLPAPEPGQEEEFLQRGLQAKSQSKQANFLYEVLVTYGNSPAQKTLVALTLKKLEQMAIKNKFAALVLARAYYGGHGVKRDNKKAEAYFHRTRGLDRSGPGGEGALWAPLLYLGIIYLRSGKLNSAENALSEAQKKGANIAAKYISLVKVVRDIKDADRRANILKQIRRIDDQDELFALLSRLELEQDEAITAAAYAALVRWSAEIQSSEDDNQLKDTVGRLEEIIENYRQRLCLNIKSGRDN